MEKQKTITRQIEETEHEFYCDECNTYIGKSLEYPDRYYRSLGVFEQKICISSEWYTIRKCLCEDCNNKQIKKLINSLTELGFEKDKY